MSLESFLPVQVHAVFSNPAKTVAFNGLLF